MQVATGIDMLQISAQIMGRPMMIYPTLIWDQERAILVDTGFPGQLGLFQEAVAAAGVEWAHLRQVILTHQDIDHLGGLPGILKESPQPIEVAAGRAEVPYIQGELPPIKLTPAVIERMLASLPPEMPAQTKAALRAGLEHPPTAKVEHPLADGDVLPACGGIDVIETPGHTPGHICLYHRASKTLITGDALQLVEGQLQGPSPQVTLNLEQATASLRKLLRFDAAAVISYHGGLFRGDVNRRISELTSGGGIG